MSAFEGLGFGFFVGREWRCQYTAEELVFYPSPELMIELTLGSSTCSQTIILFKYSSSFQGHFPRSIKYHVYGLSGFCVLREVAPESLHQSSFVSVS